jgi:hypothetical protein
MNGKSALAGKTGLALVLVIWWTGSFWLLGDLGRWLDDYGFHRRDPVTLGFRWESLLHLRWAGGFWRPAHIGFVHALNTLTWNHVWVAHFVCALCHGLATLLLWGLLRAIGLSSRPCAAAALLYLACPIAFEVLFWPSTLSTSIATALLLLAVMIYVRFSRRLAGWWVVAPMAVLTFLGACFYEQAATGLVMLPLLYLGTRPTESAARSMVRIGVPVGAALSAGALYAYLVVATVDPGARGGASSFVTLDSAADKAWLVTRQAWELLAMNHFIMGAMQEGWRRIGVSWLPGPVWAAITTVAAWAWLNWWCRDDRAAGEALSPADASPVPASEKPSPSSPRLLWVLLAGAAAFVAGWLPAVALRNQWVVPRMCYVPLVGAAIGLAAAIELGARAVSRWPSTLRGVRVVGGMWLVLLALGGAVALVGVQSAFRERSLMDGAETAQLKKLLPSPPPNTVFMPVKVENWPVHTGSHRFDTFARGMWELQWSTNTGIKFAYRRRDVFATFYNRWNPLTIREIGPDDFVYPSDWLSHDFPPAAGGGHVVRWAQVVPFIVDARGHVSLVGRLEIREAGAPLMTIDLPLVQDIGNQPGIDAMTFTLDLPKGVGKH